MKCINHRIIGIALLIFSAFGFQRAEDPNFLQALDASLKRYSEQYREEKIYLQLDKPFYKPGEDIWFNAFVLNSSTNKPGGVSDVVYVELVDPKGNVSHRLDLAVNEGTAHGDFQLDASAPGGMYKIQAYTRWMKNFSSDHPFRKDIQVQRVVTPRLLLKLDFEKESYGPSDRVQATLRVSDLKNTPLADAEIRATVKINGQAVVTSEHQADQQGQVGVAFALPDSLTTTDGLLQLVVRSHGVEESISRSVPIVLNKISLQFFPEGGSSLQQVNSVIAFKALNEFGKGADVTGSIVDEDDNVVSRFESFHMGMGSFKLKSVPGKKYFARIESPRGSHAPVPLPASLATGYLLNLTQQSEEQLQWLIHAPGKEVAYLVGQSQGNMVFQQRIKLDEGENKLSVPTKNLPMGIVVFTLFDGEGMERCERLVFVNRDKGLSIQVKTNKESYRPGEKVEVAVKTLGADGSPVPATLSVAVVDDQLISFADDKQDNILSSVLLSSEVRGEIQEPSFYFDPREKKASEALDYLLMTQGWRRFTWKDVRTNSRVISYSPEKNRAVSGVLVGKDGTGISGEVALVEIGGKKRIAKVQATKDGQFVFRNIDPTIPLVLLTRKPNQIVVNRATSGGIYHDKYGWNQQSRQFLNDDDVFTVADAAPLGAVKTEAALGDLDMSLQEDVTSLSEVVVTGYGVEEKRLLSSSITTVQTTDIWFDSRGFEAALQGRVSGIIVQPQTGNPGSSHSIRLRGMSSMTSGRFEPLYVIDGHPIGQSLNQNFSNGSFIGPDDIESIDVINSPEATALYGSAAANGVVAIRTKSRLGYAYHAPRKIISRYASVSITPRKFSATREFYVPAPARAAETRGDFRTTVYWNHTVVTDRNGNATFSFVSNDAVSAFRVTAEGVSASGLIGRKEEVYHTALPLSLDVKLPEYLGFEDVLKLPVRVRNETSSPSTARISLNIPEGFSVQELPTQQISVKPHATETVWYTITPKRVAGKYPLSIQLASQGFKDKVDHVIDVKAIGFPMRKSFSAQVLDSTFLVSIGDAERGSVRGAFTAFPDILDDLFAGAASIIREPYGCFEQVSSSTFPNILALQFLKQSGQRRPDIENRALGYIRNGYKKLAAYEIKGGGFEWFGHPPAHEGLSAYGLLEFHEMKKVFNDVDESMIIRTRDYLLSKRDGRGGFHQQHGKYGFSSAKSEVTNAYLVYALSETGTTDIMAEYRHALAEANHSKDMYRMAVMANAAFNLHQLQDYSDLLGNFKATIEKDGFGKLHADHSIVRSYGESLDNEILSLWIIAMLKSKSSNPGFMESCIRHLVSRRAGGQFGSTQATAMALKALTEYASYVKSAREDGRVQVFVDDKPAEGVRYNSTLRDKLSLENFATDLRDGQQNIRVLFTETNAPLRYSIDIFWNTKTPQSSEQCKVSLTTSMASSSVQLNETVRMRIAIQNKSSEGVPMTTAIIGIPAGLSVQPWQLKELLDKNVFDFYEILDGNLVVYYREMGPGAVVNINLDLKAEIPGDFVARASAVYLYYSSEFKHWQAGNSISVH